MSPLWSDIALARAARAKVEEHSTGGKAQSLKEDRPSAVRRPMRRVIHPRFGSLAL
jgi:hypothetical protein